MVPGPNRTQLLLSVIYTSSITLLAFSIAIIFLEENVIHAFRDFNVQEPVTSLAEWRWISLNPDNVNTAPTTAILIAAVFSLMTAVIGFGWVTILWFGISQETARLLGITSSCLTALGTVPSLTIMAYVFADQVGQTVPQLSRNWTKEAPMNRETLLCEAFPSIVDNIESNIYGFPACQHARVARYLLIMAALLSTVIAVFSTVHLILVSRAARAVRLASKTTSIPMSHARWPRATDQPPLGSIPE